MVKSSAKVGVIGHPVAQSLSPYLHHPWMAEAGIDGEYQRIDGGLLGFEQTVRQCLSDGYLGLNVTIPYKLDALALADEVSDRAGQIGAANLLVFKDGNIFADNIDAIGFQRAVEYSGWAGPRKTARVLGAGGATPAILHALQKLGFSEIQLTNRTEAKARELSVRFDGVTILPWEERDHNLEDVNALVNTTSLGMKGGRPLNFDVSGLPETAAVFDIITTPLATELITAARKRGLYVQNGVPMLVFQAVPSFEAWFGVSPKHPERLIDEMGYRLNAKRPLKIGLTGGIGMGKTATSQMFAEWGVPVWDADEAVHRLYQPGQRGAEEIGKLQPSAIRSDGSVDRAELSTWLAEDSGRWPILNNIIHPLVAEDRAAFVNLAKEQGAEAVVLDIPLLFETGADQQMDAVVVCSAKEDIRRARVLDRPGMTAEKYNAITAQQMPDSEKRKRADFIVETDQGFDHAREQVKDILRSLLPEHVS